MQNFISKNNQPTNVSPQNTEAQVNEISADEIKLRIFKEFLDLIILIELKEHTQLSGYDLALLQNQKYCVTLSPGTVYATLYAMERRGLITGKSEGKKRTFCLSSQGEKGVETLKEARVILVDFMKCIFPLP